MGQRILGLGPLTLGLIATLLLVGHAKADALAPAAHLTPKVPLTCRMPTERGATIVFRLELSPFARWQSVCSELAKFLDLPPPPVSEKTASQAQDALMGLGLFHRVSCAAEELQPDVLGCAIEPAQLVRDVKISGHIPFALLKEDLRRRIFLRQGVRLDDQDDPLGRQEDRLRQYLVGEGYFDAAVGVVPRPQAGAEPALGQHLDMAVTARQTATVRHVRLTGDVVLPTEALAKPFFHHAPFGIRFRFRPNQLGDDSMKVTQVLKRAGYVGAHVRASFTHHPEAHAVDIVAEIIAGRRVDIELAGNHNISTRRLLKEAPFEKTEAVDAVAVETFADNIRRLYQEKGFADVRITTHVGRAQHNVLRVSVDIVEGERQYVDEVVFRGLPRDPQPLMTQAQVLIGPRSKMKKAPWVEAWVEHDVVNLRGALHQAGLSQAELDVHREPGRKPQSIRLVYTVQDTEVLEVGSLRVKGFPSHLRHLLPHLKLLPPTPFIASKLEDDTQDLETALSREGYLSAKVDATFAAMPGRPHALEVTYHAHPGRQARLGGLFVRGAFRTRPATLAQELNLRINRPLNLPALGAARRRLRALNLFNAVQLIPAYPRQGAEHAHLVLAVEERQMRSLDGVAGFSSDFRFSLGGDFRDRNFLGRAINLTLTARLSDAQHYLSRKLRIGDQDLVEAGLQAPRPWGMPFNFDAQLLYRYQDPSAFREKRLGGQVGVQQIVLEARRCRYCPQVALRLGYELIQAYRFIKTSFGLLEDFKMPSRTIARLVPTISIDARDSAIDPHRGIAGELRLEGAHPAMAGVLGKKATSFWRLMASMQGYVPLGTPIKIPISEERSLGGPLVLALAVDYAAAGAYGERGGVPVSETFSYGGDLSVRGLVNRASIVQLPSANTMVVLSTELRYFALANLGLGSLQVAGFCDVGTVADRMEMLFEQTTISAGPIVRYVTPVGPVSLAYGRALMLPVALQRAHNQAPPHGRVHFTFGYTF